jgi:hypothetical protein
MKNLFIVLCTFFVIPLIVRAGDGSNYVVSLISKDLLKGADAVMRLEEQRFEIKSTRSAIYTNHYVITILNENGDKWTELEEYYDKYRKIESVEGFLYDASGKQLKKVKIKDMEDLSGVSGSNLIDDNRIKRHNFYYRVYPYTIEYIVQLEYKSTLFFPRWIPQGGDRLSVEQSSMTVVCPADYTFRYKAFQYDKDPVIKQEKNNQISTWAVKNMPAIQKESYSPRWHELTTMVIFGPTEFQIDDYKANMQSWEDFGKFVYALTENRYQLPDHVKKEVHRLTDQVTDLRAKIILLYQYLQRNTRYISIQLGIGGWQPFPAAEVAAKSYGDCKALTNYMFSLLKEAGIPSAYTLVRAGRNATYITEDFPSQQFNHVILCVPFEKDSVWLECTSQTLPAGYLSDFTANRYALLVDKNGGHLVRTPKYGLDENGQLRKINAVLSDEGALLIKAKTNYGGLQQDNLHMLINSLSKEKVKEYLHDELDFATYDVSQFEYKENRESALPSIDEFLTISVSNYATITGRRLFITPNVMTRSYRKLTPDTARKYDILFELEYRDVDTVEIELPAGYTPEAMPQPVAISSPFGKYTSSVKLTGNKLFYYRSIEQYSGRFPAKEYANLVKYYEDVYKADRNRVVLVKNETQEKKAF